MILHVEVDVMVLEGKKVNGERCVHKKQKQNDPPFFGELFIAQLEGIDQGVGICAPNSGAISASTPC